MSESTLSRLPPPRRSLRDQLLEAEQLRCQLEVSIVTGARIAGTPIDVGVDYVTVDVEGNTVDIALFHIVSLEW